MKKILIAVVIILLAGGAYYFLNQSRTGPILQKPYNIPAGYTHIEDSEQGVSFDIPEDWRQSSQPESGEPNVVSADYRAVAMTLTGSYIVYHRYSPPEGYTGGLEEYLELLRDSHLNWTQISFLNSTFFSATTTVPQGSASHKVEGSVYLHKIVGIVDNEIVEIRYGDATSKYGDVFETFLRSFQVNKQ